MLCRARRTTSITPRLCSLFSFYSSMFNYPLISLPPSFFFQPIILRFFLFPSTQLSPTTSLIGEWTKWMEWREITISPFPTFPILFSSLFAPSSPFPFFSFSSILFSNSTQHNLLLLHGSLPSPSPLPSGTPPRINARSLIGWVPSADTRKMRTITILGKLISWRGVGT